MGTNKDCNDGRASRQTKASIVTSKTNHPVDRGWAWVIVAASFGFYFLSIGHERTFGMLFVEFQKKYGSSSAMTSAIVGTKSFVYCIVTLIVTNFGIKRFSIRTVCIAGSILQATGVFTSGFVTDTTHLIITSGVIYGCGLAFMSCPIMLLLSQYFDKRRPIATTLASCGACVGGITFPFVTRAFLDTYGLQGTLFLLSGLLLQQLLCVILYTPPSDYLPPPTTAALLSESESKESTDDRAQTRKAKYALGSGSEDFADSLPDQHAGIKECSRSNNNNEYLEENGETEDLLKERSMCEVQLVSGIDDHSLRQRHENNVVKKAIEDDTLSSDLLVSSPSVHHELNSLERYIQCKRSHDHLNPSTLFDTIKGPITEHTKSYQLDNEQHRRSHEYLHSPTLIDPVLVTGIEQINASMSSLIFKENQVLRELDHLSMTSDHNRDFRNKRHSKDRCQDGENREMEHHDKADGITAECQTNKNTSRNFCRVPDVMKLPEFWVLSIYFICGCVGSGHPAIFIPPLVEERGLSEEDAAFFLMISSLVESFGRVIPGIILSLNIMKPSNLMIFPLTVCGIMFHLTSVFNDFSSLLALSVVYGLLSSSFWPLQALIVIEVMGLDQLAPSLGFYSIFMGISSSISFPIEGALKDATGSYSSTFHFLGFQYFLAAGSIIALHIFQRCRKRTTNEDDDNDDN